MHHLRYIALIFFLSATSSCATAYTVGPRVGPTYTHDSPKKTLLWPVNGTITSHFGKRAGRLHDGIDIAASIGTPVRAAAAGRVAFSGYRSGYGHVIVLQHEHNLTTRYAHHQRNFVYQGQAIRAGEVIAKVGISGHTTGPHLHFEVIHGSTPMDPLSYLDKK